MNKLSWFCTVALVFSCWGIAFGQQLSPTDPQVTQATNVIVPLFAALKNGDVQTVRQYMTPELYKQYRVLFEQNTEYPAFLRKYYQGAKLRIKKMALVRGHTQAQVAIDFPTGTTHEGKIFLIKDQKADLKIDNFLE